MALNNSKKLPSSRILTYREGSLPTYEEATGKFQQDEIDETTSRDEDVEQAFHNASILLSLRITPRITRMTFCKTAEQQNRKEIENSLPTYEQATGRVGRDEAAEIAPSAPVLPAESQQYYVEDDRTTNYHSPSRTPLSQVPFRPREQDVERALQDPSLTRNEDPVVREMAESVLAECRRAKEKREAKAVMNIFGFFIALIFFLVFIVVKASTSR